MESPGLLLPKKILARIRQKSDLLIIWDDSTQCALSMQVVFPASCGPFIAGLSLALGNSSFSLRNQNSQYVRGLGQVGWRLLFCTRLLQNSLRFCFSIASLGLHWNVILICLWSGRNAVIWVTVPCVWVWCVRVIALLEFFCSISLLN